MIRTFEKRDIPEVADLYNQILLSEFPSKRNLPITELYSYFEKIFFENPWYTDDIPSLVYQHNDGNIGGFLGVVPRNMIFAGNPIRMANSFHFIADQKGRSSFAGLQLLKEFFAGPQDLSYTDGAGDDGKKLWVAVGGTEVPSLGLNWSRMMKPGKHTLNYLSRVYKKHKVLSRFVSTLHPFSSLADQTFQKVLPGHFAPLQKEFIEEELNIDVMLELLPQFSKSYTIQPAYDKNDLSWLLKNAEQIKIYGELKKKMVRNASGDIFGWYLYYLNRNGSSLVIQIAAKKGSMNIVLDCLFSSATKDGASVLEGRILPNHIFEMSEKHCSFNGASFTLAHSRDPELLHAIQRGDAFLSELEGEWCMLF